MSVADLLERSMRPLVIVSRGALRRDMPLRPGHLIPLPSGEVMYIAGREPAPWEAVRVLLEEPEQ